MTYRPTRAPRARTGLTTALRLSAAGGLAVAMVVSAPAVAAPTMYAPGDVGAAATTDNVATGNVCSNPVLAQDLSGWGPLDGATVSRASVTDLGSVQHAFATTGSSFYMPEMDGLAPGQKWTITVRDRLVGAAGRATTSVEFYDAAGRYVTEVAGRATALPSSSATHGSWTPVSVAFTVAAGIASAHVVQADNAGSAKPTSFEATGADYEPTVSTPSGARMPLGDLPADGQSPHGWQQVFTDDFTDPGHATANGALPDGKWWGYDRGTPITNSSNGVYDSGKVVSVAQGVMRYHLFSSNGTAYAAVESPKLSGSQIYGRYVVRYRYEPGSNVAGYKSVWMTWPDDDQWKEGELDFQEYANAADRTSVGVSFHQACAQTPCPKTDADYPLDPTVWHTATEIWSPGQVRAYVDGYLIETSTVAVASTPMHLLLQTEASDYGPVAAPSAVMNIDVDWVAVYRRA